MHRRGVSPAASVAYRDVLNPLACADTRGRVGLKIEDGADHFAVLAGWREGRLLCRERNLFAPALCAVVVVGRDTKFQRIKIALIDSVVEEYEVRLILIDQFYVALIPVDQKPLKGSVAAVGYVIKVRPFGIVKICLFGLHLFS
jgi:hypothetical protein